MIRLVVAAVALVGSVLSWLAASSVEQVAPIMDGQPAMTTVVYYPPLVVLALALATAAGVLVVLAVTRRQATRRKAPVLS